MTEYRREPSRPAGRVARREPGQGRSHDMHGQGPKQGSAQGPEQYQNPMPGQGADQVSGQVQARAEQQTPVLSGFKPVCELLERDPARIDTVLVRKGRRNADTDRLLDLCRAAGVRFLLTDAAALDRLCPTGHQGVAARLLATTFTDFDEMLIQAADAPLPLIVALDQVQDPGNAGALARTLYALGGAGLVVPLHNGVYLGAGARRAAAGALEHLPVARVTNLARSLAEAARAGFMIYAAASTGQADERSAFTEPLRLPAVLVLGSEEHGLRPLVRKQCDQALFVPMLRDFDSLNVAQAGGILIASFLQQHLAQAGRAGSRS